MPLSPWWKSKPCVFVTVRSGSAKVAVSVPVLLAGVGSTIGLLAVAVRTNVAPAAVADVLTCNVRPVEVAPSASSCVLVQSNVVADTVVVTWQVQFVPDQGVVPCSVPAG